MKWKMFWMIWENFQLSAKYCTASNWALLVSIIEMGEMINIFHFFHTWRMALRMWVGNRSTWNARLAPLEYLRTPYIVNSGDSFCLLHVSTKGLRYRNTLFATIFLSKNEIKWVLFFLSAKQIRDIYFSGLDSVLITKEKPNLFRGKQCTVKASLEEGTWLKTSV